MATPTSVKEGGGSVWGLTLQPAMAQELNYLCTVHDISASVDYGSGYYSV